MWLLALPEDGIGNVLLEAEKFGRKGRFRFMKMLDLEYHIAAKRMCDLFLDSVSFTASGTGLDAFWSHLHPQTFAPTTNAYPHLTLNFVCFLFQRAGIPLLTIAGDQYRQRIATSFLHSLVTLTAAFGVE